MNSLYYLAFSLTLFGHGLTRESCDKNSTWSCQIKSCFGTCYGIPVPQYMGNSSKCVEGCHCKDFYVRDEIQKKCVLPEDCTCPQNQSVKESNSCAQRCIKDGCPEYEITRCFCNSGLCTNDQNKCVFPPNFAGP